MRFRKGGVALGALAQLLVVPALVAAKDPELKVSTFDARPENINFFDGSDTLLFHNIEQRTIYKSTNGGDSWEAVDGVPAGKAYMLVMHEFDNDRAFILSGEREHWKTTDKGKTWSKWDSGVFTSGLRPDVLHFHAGDSDRVIFNGLKCESIFCEEAAMYTTNNFKEVAAPLRTETDGCWWAKTTREFTTGSPSTDQNRVMCIVKDFLSPFKEDQRLFYSDKFFEVGANGKLDEGEVKIETNKGLTGVVSLAVVNKFMLAATASLGTDEMGLYVTDDTSVWHRAMFPTTHDHRLNQEAYTILESTNYSIQVDVMTTRPSNPMGVLFTSNSNGTYFTENMEHTNRNIRGNVDFSKVTSIPGIYVVNTVENWEAVEKTADQAKKIVSQISFDDGRTFEKLMAGSDRMHVHSITETNNVGPMFSSPVPGLVLANGNTGDSLKAFKDSDLYVSTDSGLTWKKALSGPHMYAFGDQGSILVAVPDTRAEDVSEVFYSLNYGAKWDSIKLPNDLKIQPEEIFIDDDSSLLKFLLEGHTASRDKFHLMTIDFSGLRSRTCEDKDMEDFHARVDENGKPTCVMGSKLTFRRRKADADCFNNKAYKQPVPKAEACECSNQDFECDYNFVRKDDKTCEAAGLIIAPDGVCKDQKPDAVFKGSSGWRMIPGNQCKRPSGAQKDDLVDRKCQDSTDAPTSPPSNGGGDGVPIGNDQFVFETKLKKFEKVYLERGDSSSQLDETVLVRPYGSNGVQQVVEDKIWFTMDQGKTWKTILENYRVHGIFPHSNFKDAVFLTVSPEASQDIVKKVVYTIDRGINWHEFDLPHLPIRGNPFSFHPDKKDWILFTGQVCEEVNNNCVHEAFLSTDRGDHWKTIARQVVRCEFTGHSAYKWRNQKQIVCLARDGESDAPLKLSVSNDFFDTDVIYPKLVDNSGKDVIIKQFATMSEFIVIAAEEPASKGHLLAFASIDGTTFAEAHFPVNFRPEHSSEYTVLDSTTHAVNLFVATDTVDGRHRGNIIKSNSNGTSYVVSLTDVNCDANFFVDYEKVPGVEGIAIANVVSNTNKPKERKKLQTKITHNDGAEWMFLAPPAKDTNGKSFSCSSKTGTEKCALHFHHYTERINKRRGFSVPSAVGIMFGYGNVGAYLDTVDKADTYMSVDGGISWRQVQKGIWTAEFGDQGSLLVLIQMGVRVKTNKLLFSIDEGATWNEHKFQEKESYVDDITTLATGESRNMLVWTIDDNENVVATRVDFTGLASDGACTEKDYGVWHPRHPLLNSDCFFGHVSRYLRKLPGKKCYNDQRMSRTLESLDCECSRRDYECDFNFEMDNHGQCSLVPGHQPQTAKEYCSANPDAVAFYEPSGYRRIPLTTCIGGDEFDKVNTPIACTGHEDEFEKTHGTSAIAVFFAIVIPIAIAAAAGTWVYQNWHRNFGQIRLGEVGGEGHGLLDEDAPWVKYPVMALSGAVALAAATPLVLGSLWRIVRGSLERFMGDGAPRFTTRDSFARAGQDYAIIDEDEDGLLGEESDEE